MLHRSLLKFDAQVSQFDFSSKLISRDFSIYLYRNRCLPGKCLIIIIIDTNK